MTESPESRSERTTRRRRIREPRPRVVQALRLGIFGGGLGATAIGFIGTSLANITTDPATVMLLGAGLLTAVSSALLVHDSLIPDYQPKG